MASSVQLKRDHETQQVTWEQCEECAICGGAEFKGLFTVLRRSYVRCSSCGVVRLYDRVSPTSLNTLYDDYYRANELPTPSEIAEQLTNPTFVFRKSRLEAFVPRAGRRFFEVGCGDGNFLAFLKNAGWDVTGSEFSQNSIELVQARHGITAVPGNHDVVPAEPDSLENVGAYHVLEHLYEPVKWLRSVRQTLKPSGLLHLQVPNFGCPERLIASDCWASLCFPQHVFFYTPENLSALLVREGFRPLSIRTYDPWHSPGSTLITAKNVVRKAITGKTPWSNVTARVSEHNTPAQTVPTRVAGLGNAIGQPAAILISKAQALFGFGNVIDVISKVAKS